MTGHLLGALSGLELCAGHLDIRDPRPISTLGRLDLRNIALGLRHAWELDRMLARSARNVGVHISISQVTWGFLRDSVFVAVARARGHRVYIHLHGGLLARFYRTSRPPMRWVIRRVLGQAHRAWALTPSLRSQFDGLVPSELVACLPNVVEDPLAGSPGKRELDRGTALRILHLSNLLPDKGCFDLLAALRQLGTASARWEVRVVGSGTPEIERRLRAEISQLERMGGARVDLLGELTGSAKHEQYRWANVFAYPTQYPPEGQPLVLLEAMGAGLPVVATRWAGIPDTVSDQQEGLLVEPGNTAELARALLQISTEPELRLALSAAARKRYEDCYRPERLAADLLDLLATDA